jgi:hypothetical protein
MDILPRRAQDLTDTPALLANGNFIVDTLQKKDNDTRKTEEQRKRQAAIPQIQNALAIFAGIKQESDSRVPTKEELLFNINQTLNNR